MFAGLASPSHLIIAFAIIMLLFGAKRIPGLAKGLGSGIQEFRDGISTPSGETKSSDDERVLEGASAGGYGRTSDSSEQGSR